MIKWQVSDISINCFFYALGKYNVNVKRGKVTCYWTACLEGLVWLAIDTFGQLVILPVVIMENWHARSSLFFASLHGKIQVFRKNILGIYRFLIFEFEILRSLFFRFLVEVICRKDRRILQIYLDQSRIYSEVSFF